MPTGLGHEEFLIGLRERTLVSHPKYGSVRRRGPVAPPPLSPKANADKRADTKALGRSDTIEKQAARGARKREDRLIAMSLGNSNIPAITLGICQHMEPGARTRIANRGSYSQPLAFRDHKQANYPEKEFVAQMTRANGLKGGRATLRERGHWGCLSFADRHSTSANSFLWNGQPSLHL